MIFDPTIQMQADIAALEEDNAELRAQVELLGAQVDALNGKCDALSSSLKFAEAVADDMCFGGKAGN